MKKQEQVLYKQHLKSLKTKLAKLVHWGQTTTVRSGKSDQVSFDALHLKWPERCV